MVIGTCYTKSGNVNKYEPEQWWNPSNSKRMVVYESGSTPPNDPIPTEEYSLSLGNTLDNGLMYGTKNPDGTYQYINIFCKNIGNDVKIYDNFPTPPPATKDYTFSYIGVRTKYGDNIKWHVGFSPKSLTTNVYIPFIFCNSYRPLNRNCYIKIRIDDEDGKNIWYEDTIRVYAPFSIVYNFNDLHKIEIKIPASSDKILIVPDYQIKIIEFYTYLDDAQNYKAYMDCDPFGYNVELADINDYDSFNSFVIDLKKFSENPDANPGEQDIAKYYGSIDLSSVNQIESLLCILGKNNLRCNSFTTIAIGFIAKDIITYYNIKYSGELFDYDLGDTREFEISGGDGHLAPNMINRLCTFDNIINFTKNINCTGFGVFGNNRKGIITLTKIFYVNIGSSLNYEAIYNKTITEAEASLDINVLNGSTLPDDFYKNYYIIGMVFEVI